MTKIDYHFSITPSAVFDGVTLDYFLSKEFNTTHLVVPDTTVPTDALTKLREKKLNIIVDIEQPIWAGGIVKDTPITVFEPYFQNLKNAGVKVVSSEGGRDGDLNVIGKYFDYVNYNCDQCGLWKDFYKHPKTIMNSWESYYTWEISAIQQGITETKGLKKQGILAGVWGGSENPLLTNTKAGVAPNYYTLAEWIDNNGGLDHFHAWGGLSAGMLDRYKDLGFEPIVHKMQTIHPPNPIGGDQIANIEKGTNPAKETFLGIMFNFVAGTDQHLWYQKKYDDVESKWIDLGGIITSGPAAKVLGDTLEVSARGNDKALWTRTTKDGDNWSEWKKDTQKGVLL